MLTREVDVPVTVMGEVLVVGPAAGLDGAHAELSHRVLNWQTVGTLASGATGNAVGREVVSTDIVASARSTGEMVRAAIARISRSGPGTAAVVRRRGSGVTLLEILGRGRTTWTGIRGLIDIRAEAVPWPRTGTSALVQPWVGLFGPIATARHAALEMTSVELHGCTSASQNSIVGFADGLEPALERAVLDGLRGLASHTNSRLRGPGSRTMVGASGISELHWMLGGTLGLLATVCAPPRERLLAAGDLAVECRPIPPLDGAWNIATAKNAKSGAVVAAAWGRDTAEAARHAVREARFRRHAGLMGPGPAGPPSSQAMLNDLPVADLTELQHAVQRCLGRLGLRPLGIRVAADALIGRPDLVWGPVWLV